MTEMARAILRCLDLSAQLLNACGAIVRHAPQSALCAPVCAPPPPQAMRTAARRLARRALRPGVCAPCEHAPSLPPRCAEAAPAARAAGGGCRFGASRHGWRGFSAGPTPPPPNGPETPPDSGNSESEPEEVRARAARGAGGCTVTVSSRALAEACANACARLRRWTCSRSMAPSASCIGRCRSAKRVYFCLCTESGARAWRTQRRRRSRR